MLNRLANLNKLFSVSKRVASASVAIAMTASLSFAAVPKVAAATTTAGVKVSFTFDDGLLSTYSQAAPTLAKYGFSGTSYVTTGCIGMTTAPNTCRADTTKPYMTWAQVNALRTTYGWEIGSHTVSHPLLASTDAEDQPQALTSAQLNSELADSKAAILANTGVEPKALATPYGDWNPATMMTMAKYYSSHRGFADVGYNSFPYNDYLLYDQQVQAGDGVDVTNVPVATVKGYIDTARANNQWLILTFHDIMASGATEYAYNTADLDAIAAYIKSLNIPVVNVTDGLAGGTNLLPNSGFDTALSADIAATTVWSTDDTTNIHQDTANNGNYPGATNSIVLNGREKDIEMFSPRVAVTNTDKYFIKAFLNVTQLTIATRNEIAFYIDEYDANGVFIGTQYKKSEPSVWIENLNFEYIPTSATVKAARLQIVVTANSGAKAYVDNIGWYAQSATPGGQGGGKAGDINGDNVINALDLSILASNWGKTGLTRAQGDLNGDGTANALDLSVLATNWGK
ncbi:MAG: polysaccharide deacetylase family protein [Candidatus Saccharibacteria bacterium]|nr:polysaccharide deacetylase family protein [Candidatus Saccharibacteria bacterium]